MVKVSHAKQGHHLYGNGGNTKLEAVNISISQPLDCCNINLKNHVRLLFYGCVYLLL